MSRSVRVVRRPRLRVENLEARDVPAITGIVFQDTDQNGIRGSTETGIGGVHLHLYENGSIVDEVTTGAGGTYSFDTVQIDTAYQIRIDLTQSALAGRILSPANQGGDDSVDSDAVPDPTQITPTATISFSTVTTDLAFDAGFGGPTPTASLTLGGTVFPDPDDTGTVGAGGVAGVSVELLQGASGETVLATVTTTAAGLYTFPGLDEGIYRVRLAATNFAAGGPLDGFTPSTTSGANPNDDVNTDSNGELVGTLGSGGTIVSGPITLSAGDEPITDGDTDPDTNLTLDFGVVEGDEPPPEGGSLSGRVFLDYNNSGTFDGPDVGVAGVTVTLSGGDLSAPVAVQTDASGNYTFPGLEAGTYTLTQTQPTTPANQTGTDTAGTAGGTTTVANVIDAIVLEADEDATGYLFAEVPKVSTGGTVFVDANGNGQLDTGEAGVPDATVTLTGTSIVTGAAITPVVVQTDASGVYTFPDLDPGTYTITETQPDGFTDGAEQNGTPAGTVGSDTFTGIDLTSTAALSTGFNFGETTATGGTGSIGGFVFADADSDGVKDTAETGVPGVTVRLTGTDDEGPVDTTVTTGSDGSFSFAGLRPGTYTLAETQPATGYTDGTETAGTAGGVTTVNDTISGITLAVGQTATGYLFAETPTTTGGTASIAGSVYTDTDADGTRDAAETGISGVTVRLTGTDDEGPVDTTVTTGTDGTFSFANLRPGTYTLAETQPTGVTDGAETAGTAGGVTTTNDSISEITLTAGQTATGYLFGEAAPTTGGTGSIGGFVFADADSDGVKDAAETGVPGVTVRLTGTDDEGPVDTTVTTGTDGAFTFANLRPGTYTLTETPPATGYTDGPETAGTAGGVTTTNDSISGITLAADQTATGYLFAETPTATGGTGSIGGFVFADADGDGVKDAAETGVPGVTVRLTGTDDEGPVDTTVTTGTDGSFSFAGLRPGTYTLAETQPATGYTDGPDTAGTAGGVTTVNDTISGITLAADQAATGYLFAETPTTTGGTASIAGSVFADANGNGTRQASETGVAGVTIRLTGTDDQSQPVDRTTTTGTNGNFSFANLRPGTYTLAETQPATGYTDGTETAGTAGGVTTTNDTISGITLTTGQAATGYLFAEQPTATDDPADLRVTVRADDSTVQPGQTVELTYTVRNRGDETATGVEALVRLGGLQFVSASSEDYDSDTRIWSVGELEGDGTATLTVTVRVPAAGTYYPSARVSSTDDESIPARSNSTTVVATTAQAAGRFWFLSSFYTGRTAPAPVPTTPPVVAPPGRIAGSVFADADSDGVKDATETGIAGVAMQLTGTTTAGQPISRTTTTGAAGNYSFTGLPQGTYTVVETQPASGYTDGSETAGTAGGTTTVNDQISAIPLSGSFIRATGYLFAETPTAPAGTGSLAGTVFADADSDGVKDAAETGVGGVTVTLTGTDDQSQPVSRTATTGTDGTYSFTALRPGSYTIAETQPATGYTDGAETAGTAGGVTTTNDQISGITLTAGQAGTGYLFAEAPVAAGGTASIAGAVFTDADADGVRDTGEAGANGVTVRLTGTDDQSQAVDTTATTGTDGSFSFPALRPGTYTLTETQPPRFTDGPETAGTAGGVTTVNDTISGITLTAAQAATGYLFAETPNDTGPTPPTLLLDAASDTGTAGDSITSLATVTLTGTTSPNASVTLVQTSATTTADASGNFTFADVPLTAGANAFTVNATDDTGTQSGTATITRSTAPTVAAAPAGVSVAAGATATVDLAGTFDDVDISNTRVRFNTSEGQINVELFDEQAPKTVANFLNYVTDGDYTNAIFHRFAQSGGVPFVLQGGGFAFDADPTPSIVTLPTDPAVQNEPDVVNRSNIKGTLAMAKLGDDPNSATNQFFFNLSDNSTNLNNQNGGFTVFGRLLAAADQAVVDALTYPTQNQSAATGLAPSQRSAFTAVPLNNYTGTSFPTDTTADNYALMTGVTIVSQTEALTYSIVSNSTPTVATATISKNRLSVQGVAAGTTTLTIRATDKSGLTVDTTVTVTVA